MLAYSVRYAPMPAQVEYYPRRLLEVEACFSTDKSCRTYLVHLCWSNGFRCPEYGHDTAWPARTAHFKRAQCQHHARVTVGTIFQGTRQPFRLWFREIRYVRSHKNGARALGIQRILGIWSYVTAWAWLRKLRRAMVRPGRDLFRGTVQVDEAYVAGLDERVSGHPTKKKALVAAAAEEHGGGIGRIRLQQHNPDGSALSLHSFVLASIKSVSVVHTDGRDTYKGIETFGYKRKVTVVSTKRKQAYKLLPRFHRVSSILKCWSLATNQVAMSREHLEYYLDEFMFRFNRRISQNRGKLYYRLLQQALQTAPAPYTALAKRIRPGPEHGTRRRKIKRARVTQIPHCYVSLWSQHVVASSLISAFSSRNSFLRIKSFAASMRNFPSAGNSTSTSFLPCSPGSPNCC